MNKMASKYEPAYFPEVSRKMAKLSRLIQRTPPSEERDELIKRRNSLKWISKGVMKR